MRALVGEPRVEQELQTTEYVCGLDEPSILDCCMKIFFNIGLQQRPKFAKGRC
jgi:hypothetical protein